MIIDNVLISYNDSGLFSYANQIQTDMKVFLSPD